jgi:methionyl-tRNA formyltransferase
VARDSGDGLRHRRPWRDVGEGSPGDRGGELVDDEDGLALATAHGRLRLLELQLAGGRRMTAADLRRGAGRALAGTLVSA